MNEGEGKRTSFSSFSSRCTALTSPSRSLSSCETSLITSGGITRCLTDSGGACFIASLTSLRSDSPTRVMALNEKGLSYSGGRGGGGRGSGSPSLLARASGTSNTMKVDLDRPGHLVVHDVLNSLDIESAHPSQLSQPVRSRSTLQPQARTRNQAHPRLARSVANKNAHSPSLNLLKLASLCSWVKSPCNSSLRSKPSP